MMLIVNVIICLLMYMHLYFTFIYYFNFVLRLLLQALGIFLSIDRRILLINFVEPVKKLLNVCAFSLMAVLTCWKTKNYQELRILTYYAQNTQNNVLRIEKSENSLPLRIIKPSILLT